MMKILIDNGHGYDTAGKCSPDKRLLEWKYTRMIAEKVVAKLRALGHDAELLTPENNDVPLTERAKRANRICAEKGESNVLLVSIHCDAAGNGDWMTAKGWSAFTTKGKTKADELAECLYDEAERNFPGRKIRTDYSDGDRDKEEQYYILRKTMCAAVLTENFFMDNKEDLEFLLSEEGIDAVVKTHVCGIINYILKRK